MLPLRGIDLREAVMNTERAIDWNDVRGRIEFAGDILRIPSAEILRLVQASDDEIDQDLLVRFSGQRRVPMDWLLFGDVSALLRIAALGGRRRPSR